MVATLTFQEGSLPFTISASRKPRKPQVVPSLENVRFPSRPEGRQPGLRFVSSCLSRDREKLLPKSPPGCVTGQCIWIRSGFRWSHRTPLSSALGTRYFRGAILRMLAVYSLGIFVSGTRNVDDSGGEIGESQADSEIVRPPS